MLIENVVTILKGGNHFSIQRTVFSCRGENADFWPLTQWLNLIPSGCHGNLPVKGVYGQSSSPDAAGKITKLTRPTIVGWRGDTPPSPIPIPSTPSAPRLSMNRLRNCFCLRPGRTFISDFYISRFLFLISMYLFCSRVLVIAMFVMVLSFRPLCLTNQLSKQCMWKWAVKSRISNNPLCKPRRTICN